jgi:uncharacterized lipoprotein YddW (UPF0748 family)
VPPDFEVKGVWCGPSDCGTSRETVAAFLDRLAEHGFNAIFMNVKGGGLLYWPSSGFPEAVAEGYHDFDLPAVLLEECGRRGIQFHAWMFDFFENESHEAFRRHPEWAMRDARGRTTADEWLRGKRFGGTWMCPARRPGYADQWLVPIYREFAQRYAVTSIHHDYVRYPGDLAPDQYCFCDFCLEALPAWARLAHGAYREEPFLHEKYDREYLEAHWEPSPRVLPAAWDRLDRAARSRFLLDGSYFHGGRADLDYFFYRYRVEAISQFVREAHQAVKEANPDIKLSGAFFKNPIQSGRFIGQDWREFASGCEICVPMNYRDHFPGTFEQYLDLLEETVYLQKQWAAGFEALYIGVAVNFLFKEEPDGPFPPEKLELAIARIASTGVPGIVVFCESQLHRFGMWEAVRRAWT